ncbi:hypothetical protein D3C71_1668440 [compost metagenome]
MIFIPAAAHLYRNGLVHNLHHGRNHLFNLGRVQEPSGAGVALGYLGNRTTHIDIDDIRIGILVHKPCRFHQRLLVTAENLQA